MAANKKLVTVGKPKLGGGVYVAPAGTTPPTDANTALAEAFKCLGYVSEDGLTNQRENDEEIRAWGGDIVMKTMTDTFGFTLIEAMNVDVLKLVYGDDNVTGDMDTGIAIIANEDMQADSVLVFDLVFQGGVLKRIVVPSGQVTEVGEITYADGEAVGYETTIQANRDEAGNTHYEYIAKKPTVTPGQ